MAGFPTHLILTSVLCWLIVSAAARTLKELTGALGGSVTFPLNFTVKQGDTFIWTFNAVSLAAIQAAVEGEEATVIVTHTHNKERIVFPDGGYSLQLGPLEKNDTGVYRVEMHGESSRSPFIQEYALHVYEYLSKPKVAMGLQDVKNGTCVTNLTCFMDQEGKNVTYSWKVVGQAANESHEGSILPISWRLRERGMTFVCIARNPISTNSSNPILAWELCEGAANGLDSSVFLPIYLCLAFLLIFFAMVSIVLIRANRLKDTTGYKMKMNIHQEIPNSCPSVEENTVYDTIQNKNKINPEEDQIGTLYSVVKIPKVVTSPPPCL